MEEAYLTDFPLHLLLSQWSCGSLLVGKPMEMGVCWIT